MIRGVPQLQRLVVRYCPHGGSSRGARAFVFDEFAKFAEANPAVECRSELGRGKHPVVRGSYVWGDDKVLDAKNRSSDEVMRMAEVLRDSSGRKMLRFEKPVVSEKPSIQGPALGGAPPSAGPWIEGFSETTGFSKRSILRPDESRSTSAILITSSLDRFFASRTLSSPQT